MNRVVYENETFEASPEEEAVLRRALRGDIESNGRLLRIVRRAGHLRLGDNSSLVIRSRKANGAGLLAWLAYGDPSLRALQVLGSIPDSVSEADFGGLVARLFCMETWRAIQSSGLMRAYQRQQVLAAVVRGRIDFAALARTGGDLSRTPCVVFARLPRTPLNSLLSAAVAAIGRDHELRAAADAVLPPLAALLADVPPVVDNDMLTGKRALSRIEQAFEASAALARLVVRSSGLANGAELPGPSFLLNLAALFESTVVRAFRESHVQSIPKRPVTIQRSAHAGADPSPHTTLELDLFLPNVQGEPVVVDAKYKSQVSAANLHQMAAYCWLTGARRAVLVVPADQVMDRRSFLMHSESDPSETIRIDLVELALGGRTLAAWHEAARQLVVAINEQPAKIEQEPAQERVTAGRIHVRSRRAASSRSAPHRGQ